MVGLTALVLEDRNAMVQMFCGMLKRFGIESQVFPTVSDALSAMKTFRPDMVILDSSVDGGNGMSFVSAITPVEEEKESRKERRKKIESVPPVLVVHTVYETVPSDCTFLKASLVRPFTSEQLIDSIKKLVSRETADAVIADSKAQENSRDAGKGDEEAEADRARIRQNRERLTKLYQDVPAADPRVELARMGMTFGESYVFFEERPIVIHQAVQIFANAGFDMFLLTSARAKVARERFGLDLGTEVFTLTGTNYPLGTMISAVERFVTEKERPLVAIGNLDNIIEHCGTDMTLRAIQQILSFRNRETNFTLLVSVDGDLLASNVKKLLTEMMTEYKEV